MASFWDMIGKDDRWGCKHCFSRNPSDAVTCDTCRKPRPGLDAAPAPAAAVQTSAAPLTTPGPAAPPGDFWSRAAADDRWKCNVCLVRNKKELNACASCENPRPGAAPVAPKAASTAVAAPGGFHFGFAAPSAPAATSNNPFFTAGNPFFAAQAAVAAAPAPSAAANLVNPFAGFAKPVAAPAPAPAAGGGGFNWGGLAPAPAAVKKEEKKEQLAAHDYFAAIYDQQAAASSSSSLVAASAGGPVSEHPIHHPWRVAAANGLLTKKKGLVALGLGKRSPHQFLYAWGNGDCEQLGQGDMDDFTVLLPSLVTRLIRVPVVRVAAGGLHTLALSRDGRVWSWGCNDDGAIGRPGGRENVPGVVKGLGPGAPPVTRQMVAESSGKKQQGQHAIVLSQSGSVNDETPIVDVSAGDSHSLALDAKGRVFAWGTYKGAAGYLGFDADTLKQPYPRSMPLLDQQGPIVAISSGSDHSCVLTASGKALTWGYGGQGQTGLSIPENSDHNEELKRRQLTPNALTLPASVASGSAAGSKSASVSLDQILRSGVMGPYSSYYNAASAVGATSTAARGSRPAAKKQRKHGASAESDYETTDNEAPAASTSPASLGITINPLAGPVVVGAFAAGYSTFLVVRSLAQDGGASSASPLLFEDRLFACGLNSYGQLGTNDLVNRAALAEVTAIQPHLKASASQHANSKAVAVQSGDSIVSIAGGSQHTVLLLGKTGRVCTFGRGDSGQLGLGENRQELLPVSASCMRPTVINPQRFVNAVTNDMTAVVQVSANSCCSGCVTADGGLYMWGFGENGQIGSGKDDKDENMPFPTLQPRGDASAATDAEESDKDADEESNASGEVAGSSSAALVGSKRSRSAALASSHVPVAIPSLPQDPKALGLGKRAKGGDLRGSEEASSSSSVATPQAKVAQLSIGGQHCVAIASGGLIASKLMPAVRKAAKLADDDARVTLAFSGIFGCEEDPKPEDLSSDDGEGDADSGADAESSESSTSDTEHETTKLAKAGPSPAAPVRPASSGALGLSAAPAPAPAPAALAPILAPVQSLFSAASGASHGVDLSLAELQSLASQASQPGVRLMLQGVAMLLEGMKASIGVAVPPPSGGHVSAVSSTRKAEVAPSSSRRGALKAIAEEAESDKEEREEEELDGDDEGGDESEEVESGTAASSVASAKPGASRRGAAAAQKKAPAGASKKGLKNAGEAVVASSVGSKRKAPSSAAPASAAKRGGKPSAASSAPPSSAKRARKA